MDNAETILSYIITVISSCPFIDEFAYIHVDYSNQDEPVNYGVFSTGQTSLPSDRFSNRWQYNFILQAENYTTGDVQRLKNRQFLERFEEWMRNLNRDLPHIGDGYDPEYFVAENDNFVNVSDTGDKGTYQIMCNLIYEKEI